MKKFILAFVIIFLTGTILQAQNLYVKTFGDAKAKPIIFLHGGPGYNSSVFEATTAQKLADAGYFIIVYDRRGEGRSINPAAAYTFQQTFADLDSLYQAYHLTKATLMGHSFGGVVATEFAKTHPDKINTLLLVSAPINLQKTFKNIIARSADIYKAKNDTTNLKYIAMFPQMDTASLMYSSYVFMHAMQNGFYSPKAPTEEAKVIYTKFRSDSLLKYGSQMTQAAPTGFWKNEHYTTLDLTSDLQDVKKKGMKVYAIYGKEDGLYSPQQVTDAEAILGKQNVLYFDNASHNVFMDQQTLFINAVKNWVK
jgi:proline iminopeptidase